jgi:putative glutamine amidotransferase
MFGAGWVADGEYSVNSRHHQAVERVALGLRVTGVSAADGLVESFELQGARFAIGVQWHPEDRVVESDLDSTLFRAFREAVR